MNTTCCIVTGFFQITSSISCASFYCFHLKIVHQAVLAAPLFTDGKVIAECAGSVCAVHCVHHCVVMVTGCISDNSCTLKWDKINTVRHFFEALARNLTSCFVLKCWFFSLYMCMYTWVCICRTWMWVCLGLGGIWGDQCINVKKSYLLKICSVV